MENVDFSGITVKEVMAFIIIFALVLLIAILVGSITTETTENRMVRQSLEGYTATANYKTNSVGEVSIQSMQWSKK